MWMNSEGYGMGWHGLGWLGMVTFWLLLVLLVLVAVKYLAAGHRSRLPDNESGKTRADALAILDQRYARGEVERDEYLQKRDDLTH
jgi:putative membrane protein